MDFIRKKKRILCCLLAFLILATYTPRVYAAEESAQEADSMQEANDQETESVQEEENTLEAESMQEEESSQEEESMQEEELLAPYFIIQDGEDGLPGLEHFPLRSTDVVANVNGMIAEIYVTQTYANNGDTPINARYVFPTSSDVTVHGMEMRIGNELITAQIKEKEEAKTEYKQAQSEGKSAALLEQKRPNVFTMDVANILPGDLISIQLHYTQLITPEEGIYEFVFPTVVGPRYAAPVESETVSDGDSVSSGNYASSDNDWISTPYLADGATPPGEYNITVNLSTGVPITEVTCKSHAIDVRKSDSATATITLADQNDYAGNRDFILKYKLSGEEIQSGLVLASGQSYSGPFKSENFFMLTIQPPERFEPEDIVPREYIFVLDISGSMIGYPLDTAKELISDLVTSLGEDDLFDVILFANETILLGKNSVPAAERNVRAAISMINRMKGGGGTSLLPALKKAVSIPEREGYARSIVIITDGYVSNDSEIIDFISENMNSASFFSFGIGTSVNDYLIKQIAGCGLGESFIVTDSEDAADAAARFRTYIEAPLLTDISISIQGFEAYDVEPSVPSILYAKQPIVLFGKWHGSPTGTITITGKTGGQDYTQVIPVEDVNVDVGSEAIRYLWARTHLDRIAGYGSVRNDKSVKEEITMLGLEYNMVTPYTSFIAVTETIRNTGEESTDVEQAQPLPQRVSNFAVGGGYRAYSEPEIILLILPLAAAFLTKKRKDKRELS